MKYFFVTFQETMDRFSFNGNKQIGLGLISGGGGKGPIFISLRAIRRKYEIIYRSYLLKFIDAIDLLLYFVSAINTYVDISITNQLSNKLSSPPEERN